MLRLLRLLSTKRRLVTIAASAAVLAACGGGDGASALPSAIPQSTSNTGTSEQDGSGEATLSWAAPNENTDGTALTNLAGYRIYYGASADTMNAVIDIPSIGTTTYVLDNLGAGTYYFSIRAYNSDGTESALSNIVSDTIPSS